MNEEWRIICTGCGAACEPDAIEYCHDGPICQERLCGECNARRLARELAWGERG